MRARARMASRHPERALLRLGAISIVLSMLINLIATLGFHGGTPPEDLAAVLPQFAANDAWILIHLVQFGADVLLLVGFVALYRSIITSTTGVSAGLARLGIVLAAVS